MKILVTGANGQVGFCLVRALANTSWDFLSLARDQLDITDAVAVRNIMSSYVPDIVINAAAYTAVDKAESELEQAYKINCDGARNLAEAAKLIGAAIFHISTDYVFAGDSTNAYTESDTPSPQGVYGKSKFQGELAVVAGNERHIILRTAWVFAEHGNNFVKTMIRLGREREQLSVVADQYGGPTYAGDIANAFIVIARQFENEKNIPWGIYHFSGYPHTSWFGFASDIFKAVSNANIYTNGIPMLGAISTAQYPTPAKRPANSRLNCCSIQNNFGITPSDWKNALKNISAYS